MCQINVVFHTGKILEPLKCPYMEVLTAVYNFLPMIIRLRFFSLQLKRILMRGFIKFYHHGQIFNPFSTNRCVSLNLSCRFFSFYWWRSEDPTYPSVFIRINTLALGEFLHLFTIIDKSCLNYFRWFFFKKLLSLDCIFNYNTFIQKIKIY